MTTYRITSKSSGADLGTYDGATARDAIEAMWRDAGYSAPFDAADDDGEALCDADALRVEVQ